MATMVLISLLQEFAGYIKSLWHTDVKSLLSPPSLHNAYGFNSLLSSIALRIVSLSLALQ
ncbi:hypothetical protein OIDMADRAFT_17904 [Oidiodendron maius Zn]|uniref:Uncharacterized protein n=1 Tax=Oidiodendron maius (strain Zn) TaxID=913774 RepID=A0A0C3H592_OIDMZ|nr:hypothetical protein OIDMADRAFT_17904 [Oidiodendron maius Zn]